MHANFYTGSLVIEIHPFFLGNLSLAFHYFKSFTKSLQDYTFET